MTTVVTRPRLTQVIQSQRGPQGPAGGVDGLAFNVAFGDVADRVLFTMPIGGLVQVVTLNIDTPWNGAGASLAVTSTLPNTILFDAIGADPSIEASFDATPAEHLPAGAQIHFLNTPGAGCTQGAGVVVLDIVFD